MRSKKPLVFWFLIVPVTTVLWWWFVYWSLFAQRR
jgi:hypothetical protein